MNELQTIYEKGVSLYGNTPEKFTDKGSAHNYIDTYFNIFSTKEKFKILEIGVRTGGSIWLWKNFLKLYEIWGIDILEDFYNNRPFTSEIKDDPNIFVKWGRNSFDSSSYEDLPKDFDIIIDDGDHSSQGVIKTFIYAWNHLKLGGIYIIEDLQSEEEIGKVEHKIKEVSPNSIIEVLKLQKQGDDNIVKIIKN